jgi:hypothetical protein
VSTMQRARRVALVAVLALVGGLALAGCRSQPGEAIYVGAAKYSQQYVDDLSEQLLKVPGFTLADGRQTIAQWIVMRDLGKRMVADNGWPAPSVDEEAATGQFQNALQANEPATAQKTIASIRPLIQLYAQYQGYNATAQQHAGPAQPTDADYADLYQRAKAAGLVDPGTDEAAYRQSLGAQNDQLFRANIGLRNMYLKTIKKANVSVNPKYAPVELTLLHDSNNHALVVIPLNAKTAAPAVVPAPGRNEAPAATS